HPGRPLAGRVDDALRADRAGGRLDSGDTAPRVQANAGDPNAGDDLPALRRGPARQLACDAVRLEVSVVRDVHGAVEALPAHHGADPKGLARCNDADIEPKGACPAHAPA